MLGPMRNVIANISLSLDGRVAGPGGEYDMSWIVPHAVSAAARDHMVRVTGGATTALLGRKNYQGFSGFWPSVAGDENADERDRAFARWLDGVEKVVFSTTLDRVDWRNARLAAADPAATVKELRAQEGGDIVVLASTSVIQQLLAAGEIDRLSVTLCPELVGGGARPFFADDLDRSSWTLTDTARTDSGALCLLYSRNAG
ncbi:riboflavin biosynthesis protein RibD [Actinomadura rayongensis]|uniref:Riboflavin biosynthesis protein RibD n=2 Tax=Actinomadura rayongensis TaxID=1429076 RepID=A0A6I4WMY4_9ACTN|nr:riboflavin biosynthesis protein RibD [Actinomadura rayongensis]